MADGKPFVIWVTFDIKPGTFDEFHKAALEDAADSVAKEEGCLEFDVLIPTSATNQLSLFEVYINRAAFDKHCTMPHFHKFAAVAERVVTGKNATEWSLAGGHGKYSR
jgi:(4S)-4-hydroxy-5-phosphonooxypentane-2,3-dione isomerase